MAISIDQQPRAYSVAGHPVVIGLSSDNSAEDGFRYRVHVEVGTDPNDQVFLFVPASSNPTTLVDIRSLIDNRLNDLVAGTVHSQSGASIYGEDVSGKVVTVSISEWWLVDGILTEEGSGEETFQFFFINGWFDNKSAYAPAPEGTNTDYAFNLNGNTKRFFSDRKFNTHIWDRSQSFGITPSAQTIFIPVFESDYGVLGFCNNNSEWMISNPIDKIQITIYASNGTPTTYTETIGGGGEPLANAFVYPANLNASTIVGIVKPMNYPNWRFYTVRALNSSNVAVSALYVFYNAELYGQSDCKHNKVRLAWQNSRGGWDYFNFIKKNEESLNIERTTFRKLRGYDTGGNFDYGAYQAGTTIQAVKATKSLTITSDWISENEFVFLQSLLVSRQVHWLQDDGTFYPVVIDNTDYTLARERNGKLKNLNLKLSMANQYV